MEKLFHMTQKELSIYDLVIKVEEKRITQLRASELLNISERHFRRLLKAYREYGPDGLISKKRGLCGSFRLYFRRYSSRKWQCNHFVTIYVERRLSVIFVIF